MSDQGYNKTLWQRLLNGRNVELCSTLAAGAALITNVWSRATQNKLAPSITTHH